MIKYARAGKAIPHERVFKLDSDNLVTLLFVLKDSKISVISELISSVCLISGGICVE